MSESAFRHVRVRGISGVVPEQFIDIDDEIAFYRGDAKLLERNKKILGLGRRYVADERTDNSDLCEAAARDLLAGLHLDTADVDALIVVSTSHDYHYPASACVLHGRLGLEESCTCFDLSGLACSAYVHGLLLAHSLIAGGTAKRCLLLAGEISSRHSDRRNRNSNMLFGDAATATLLEYTPDPNNAFFVMGTRGSGWDRIIAPAGGYSLPVLPDIAGLELNDEAGNVWRLTDDIMKGLDVFRFTMDVGPKGLEQVLHLAGLSREDVDYFAFHQANRQIVRTVAMYAHIPECRYSTDTFKLYGNCGSTAVAMDLCRQLALHPEKKVCLATFGVGFSWGFSVLDMEHTTSFGIRTFIPSEHAKTRKEKIDYWISYFKEGNHADR